MGSYGFGTVYVFSLLRKAENLSSSCFGGVNVDYAKFELLLLELNILINDPFIAGLKKI